MCFVLPSLFSAFISSIPCIWLIYSLLFSSGPKPTPLPGVNATFQALFIGLVIPTLSAIIPVRKALSVNLSESLNTQRKGNENQLVSFHDSKKLNIVPYLLFGLIGSGFGLAIYIMLPLSLLKQNYGLILDVFLAILIGMLLGITLLVSNFQAFLEILLVYLFLFFEKSSMRLLVRKNLIAHRRRNKLSSIIYSMTLGAVIFLIVSSTLTLQQISAKADEFTATDIYVEGWAIQHAKDNGDAQPMPTE